MPAKRKSRIRDEFSRSKNSEKIVAKNIINGFKSKGSRGEFIIEEIISHKINEVTLKCVTEIATIISKIGNIKLSRNHKRSKVLLVKWFDQNEENILPLIKLLKVNINFENPNIDKNINQPLEQIEQNEKIDENDESSEQNKFSWSDFESECVDYDFDIEY